LQKQKDAAVPSPVFAAIETQFTWVIKQTLVLLARTFSVRFAGNSAGKIGGDSRRIQVSLGSN
jgi:hypothetical protein